MLCSSGGKYRGEQGEAGHMGHGGTGEVPHSYSQLLQAIITFCSATDPHPDGSFSLKYGSDFGSFHHQAKIVRKTLIPTVLRLLYDFLSLKNYVHVPVFRLRIRILML
jgi:hypothetical protein